MSNKCEKINNKSALEFPGDVDMYIAELEELEFGALLCPFKKTSYSLQSLFTFLDSG